MNFPNKIWLDSLTMRSFEEELMRVLSVTVNAITEVLAVLEKGDGIDLAAKLLDDLMEKVRFQNEKNEGVEAENAHKQIAQLKLYLACQQSGLVGGPAKLSVKWSANVRASLAERRDTISNSLQFSEKFMSGELRRFIAVGREFVPSHCQG
jgi:hypothetical protein